VPVVEWLRAHGCPWDSRVLTVVRGEHRGSCFAVALRHAVGCPRECFELSRHGELPLVHLTPAVQALHDSGRGDLVNLAELCRGAERAGNVDVAEWLVCDLGYPISSEECANWSYRTLGYAAAGRGCLRLLQHLHSGGLHVLSLG
jgi:hypothetical protein